MTAQGKRETRENIEAIVSRFGFSVREVSQGYFLAPYRIDRFGHRSVGQDAMLIKHSGEIVSYCEHMGPIETNGFYAAELASAALTRSRQP